MRGISEGRAMDLKPSTSDVVQEKDEKAHITGEEQAVVAEFTEILTQ